MFWKITAAILTCQLLVFSLCKSVSLLWIPWILLSFKITQQSNVSSFVYRMVLYWPSFFKNRQEKHENQLLEVYCRFRELKNKNDSVALKPISETQLQDSSEKIYQFKHVFPESTSQDSVFDKVAFPLVSSLIGGHNGKSDITRIFLYSKFTFFHV